MVRLPRRSALVPYTSLFRSGVGQVAAQIAGDLGGIAAPEVGLDGAAVGEGARAHDQESAAVVAAVAVDLCEGDVAGVGEAAGGGGAGILDVAEVGRSEERRVGKESVSGCGRGPESALA